MTEEMVDVIDDNDNIIDTVPKSEMRDKNLKHRTVFFIVLNKKGEILVVKRSKNRRMYPGLYEVPGGTVSHGESYEETVHRELEEEFGIKNLDIKFLFDLHYKDHQRNELAKAYTLVYDGEINPQDEEAEEYFFASPEEIKSMIREGKKEFAKQRIVILEKYFGEKLR